MEQMGLFVGESAKSQAQFLASMSADADAFKARKEGDLTLLQEQVCNPIVVCSASRSNILPLHNICPAYSSIVPKDNQSFAASFIF